MSLLGIIISLNEKINWFIEHYSPTNLLVTESTTLGTSDSDTLTVLGTSTFESPVTFVSHVDMLENINFGTDSSNTVTATGTVTAPHFTIPAITENSLKLGTSDIIIYRECVDEPNLNIYTEYPNSVIVQVKNTHEDSTSVAIYYTSSTAYITLTANSTAVFLKTSTTAFTRIQ